MRSLLIVLALCTACSKKTEQAPPPATTEPAIPEAEIKRGQDACNGYVAKLCACAETVPAAKDKCELAKSLPEAITVATGVTMSKDSSTKDVKQAAASIRATIKSCIEQTAQLPALGCPP